MNSSNDIGSLIQRLDDSESESGSLHQRSLFAKPPSKEKKEISHQLAKIAEDEREVFFSDNEEEKKECPKKDFSFRLPDGRMMPMRCEYQKYFEVTKQTSPNKIKSLDVKIPSDLFTDLCPSQKSEQIRKYKGLNSDSDSAASSNSGLLKYLISKSSENHNKISIGSKLLSLSSSLSNQPPQVNTKNMEGKPRIVVVSDSSSNGSSVFDVLDSLISSQSSR